MFGRRPPRLNDFSSSDTLEDVAPVKACTLCVKKTSKGDAQITLVSQLIHDKYFDTFNFYFAKPINEILANIPSTPHIIWFKDYQIIDEEGEYLKRFYRMEEVKPRVDILTEFYKNNYKAIHPNLLATDCNQLMTKRSAKQDKLFYHRVNKENDDQIIKQAKDFQEIFDVKNKILHTNLSASSFNKVDDSESHHRQYVRISYETEDHDIYSMISGASPSKAESSNKFRQNMNLRNLNILDNLEQMNHSQVNWSDQDRELTDVFEHFNNTKLVAHIQKICRQSMLKLEPIPTLFIRKQRSDSVSKKRREENLVTDTLTDLELNTFRKDQQRKDSMDSKPLKDQRAKMKEHTRPQNDNPQFNLRQLHSSNTRFQISQDHNDDNNYFNRLRGDLSDSQGDHANHIISTSTQMPINNQQSKGKLLRVHSDTSTIQNVLTQFQDVKKSIPEKDLTPKPLKNKVIEKPGKQVNTNLKPNLKMQQPELDANYINSLHRINSQETPESVKLQQCNFMIRDQYKGQPNLKTQEISQGYQGSQKSIMGNNISASSIINQNGSSIIRYLIYKQLKKKVLKIDTDCKPKGSLTERLMSPENAIKNPGIQKILQVNQMSSHMNGPMGNVTDRQQMDNGLVNYLSKSKADQLQYSSQNNLNPNQYANPAFTEEFLIKIQDMQLKKNQAKVQQQPPASQRIAQMPQKYLIQSQYNTLPTKNLTLAQKAKSTGKNQVASLSKNQDIKMEENNHSNNIEVNYFSQRSQDSSLKPQIKQDDKSSKLIKDKIYFNQNQQLQHSQNTSNKSSSHQQRLFYQPSTTETQDEYLPSSMQYSSAHVSNKLIGPSTNSSMPASPLKKFDFKLNLNHLKKEPLQDCQEEVNEDEDQNGKDKKSFWTQRVKNAVVGKETPQESVIMQNEALTDRAGKVKGQKIEALKSVGLEVYLINHNKNKEEQQAMKKYR